MRRNELQLSSKAYPTSLTPRKELVQLLHPKRGIGQKTTSTYLQRTNFTMPSLLIYAVTALITYIAYSQLFALFQTVAHKAPPVAANSWWAFLSGKSVPGGVLIEQFYEKVR